MYAEEEERLTPIDARRTGGIFINIARRELGDRFEHFQCLDSFAKSSFALGSEAWEEYSSGLLSQLCT